MYFSPHVCLFLLVQYDVDLPFLEACLRGGVLQFWSGINLHLYRATAPETVQDTYRKTRALIRQYLPAGSAMPPLISGEWGCTDFFCVFPNQFLTQTVTHMHCNDHLPLAAAMNRQRLTVAALLCLLSRHHRLRPNLGTQLQWLLSIHWPA